MKARHRERWALGSTGLGLVALFEMWPELDLHLASMLYADAGSFPGEDLLWVQMLYRGTPWLGRLLFIASALVLLLACWRWAAIPRKLWRRAAAVQLVFLLGIGLVVHAAFKEQWGRPRPYELQVFAGAQAYVPALRPTGPCRGNCSFVSGHAATGFALLSVAMFAPRSRRRQWFVWATCSGLLIGAGRMLQGGHFLSDVLFAGWLMWAVTAVVREGWLWAVVRRRALKLARSSAAPGAAQGAAEGSI